jgi:cyclophilin family peptidyl-prolyl cis-trans isomerase
LTAGCGSSSPKPAATATTAATTATTAPPTSAPGCKAVAAPQARSEPKLSRPRSKLAAGKSYSATLRTNCGTIVMALDVKRQPRTVASFVALARRGFFDGLTFHRIATTNGVDFVIQGGDPTGSGNGGPGYTITEKPPAGARYTRGVVAMAKTGVEPAGTSGSQFFIVTAADAQLPPDYAILGRVTSGEQTVSKIAAAPADASSFPIYPIVISKLTIKTS